jgi:hypothetical protein
MKWIIAGVVVTALIVTWVLISIHLDRKPILTCPAGSVRLHEHCIPVDSP